MHKGEGHRQRLREKFLASGLSGFHDYEVIELLLTLATPRKDCKTAAKEALKRFKNFPGVLEASPGELQQIQGIGPKNVLGLKLIRAAADRYLEKRLIDRDPLSNSQDLFKYLNHCIRDKEREAFLAIFLNAKNRVLATEILFEGTLTASSVYPREVLMAALEHRSAAVIFAHNHPSGDSQPSPDDIQLTRRLVFACQVADISVHDHLIVATNSYFSFADQGYIRSMRQEYEKIK